MKLKIVSIGYGRHLFDKENIEYKRLDLCAKAVSSIDHIIFSLKSDNLHPFTSSNNLSLHPTSSKHRLLMLFDAVRIGSKLVKARKINVISTQDLFETGLVGLLLKIRYPGITLQVQEHGDVMSSRHWKEEKLSNVLRYWFAIFLLKQADIVRVVSERTKMFLKNKIGRSKKIHKLPVIVDTASFTTIEQEQNIQANDTFTFITAARFVSQKNFPLMLHAFQIAHEKYPSMRLKIFGKGPLQMVIVKMIEDLKLSAVVEVHGWTKNLAAEMTKADAYLLTSNYEGWARVLIESMLLHLPIVTTDVGCVGEVVKDGQHGLVVPVDDIEYLSRAMQEIYSDQVLYKKLKDNLRSLDTDGIPGTRLDEYAALWAQTLQ